MNNIHLYQTPQNLYHVKLLSYEPLEEFTQVLGASGSVNNSDHFKCLPRPTAQLSQFPVTEKAPYSCVRTSDELWVGGMG